MTTKKIVLGLAVVLACILVFTGIMNYRKSTEEKEESPSEQKSVQVETGRDIEDTKELIQRRLSSR